MIEIFIVYALLYVIAAWTFWQNGEKLTFKKYTLAFIIMLVMREIVRMLF
jgi:hypothetical protein